VEADSETFTWVGGAVAGVPNQNREKLKGHRRLKNKGRTGTMTMVQRREGGNKLGKVGGSGGDLGPSLPPGE